MQAAVQTREFIGGLPHNVEGFSRNDHCAESDHGDPDRGLQMYEAIDCNAYESVWHSIELSAIE